MLARQTLTLTLSRRTGRGKCNFAPFAGGKMRPTKMMFVPALLLLLTSQATADGLPRVYQSSPKAMAAERDRALEKDAASLLGLAALKAQAGAALKAGACSNPFAGRPSRIRMRSTRKR
jgi:hypothetical protein